MRKEDYSEELEKILAGSKVVDVDLNDQMKTNFHNPLNTNLP